MDKSARGFRQLGVWRKGYEMTLDVYRLTRGFPKSEIYGLTSQIQRAAVFIPANIAEGYDRNHKKEYLQFLFIARIPWRAGNAVDVGEGPRVYV